MPWGLEPNWSAVSSSLDFDHYIDRYFSVALFPLNVMKWKKLLVKNEDALAHCFCFSFCFYVYYNLIVIEEIEKRHIFWNHNLRIHRHSITCKMQEPTEYPPKTNWLCYFLHFFYISILSLSPSLFCSLQFNT